MRRVVAIFGGLGIATACSSAPDGAATPDDSTTGLGDSDSGGAATIWCRASCPSTMPWPSDEPLVIRYLGTTIDHRMRITTDGSSDAPWSHEGAAGPSDEPPTVDQLTVPNPGPGTWLVEFQVRRDLNWPRYFECIPNDGDICPNVPDPPPAGYDPERHVVFVVEDVDTDTDTDDTDGS